MTAPESPAPHLFSPLAIREVTLRNRIAVSPMCQYSCVDGFANDWHLVHLGSRAAGGAGLVMVEATAVEDRGRISPQDMGLWKDEHIGPLARIAEFVEGQGSVAGIQIAHAGRKGSTRRPWDGGGQIPVAEGGWRTVAPSPIPFHPRDEPPEALTHDEIRRIIDAFAAAARRAVAAGFRLLEIHSAHGYLLHEFLSPITNQRADDYGGAFDNRTRMLREVVLAVRGEWPARYPLFVRISSTDWIDGGWEIEQSVRLARCLATLGVDLIDCSSGGIAPDARVPLAPGYQTPFSERMRREAGLLTGAAGLLTEPHQADCIIREGQADVVLLAREMLRDPYWPIHAARALGRPFTPPVQYRRAYL